MENCYHEIVDRISEHGGNVSNGILPTKPEGWRHD